MRQFMGSASSRRRTRGDHCGETGPREDMEDHHCEEMEDDEDEEEESEEE